MNAKIGIIGGSGLDNPELIQYYQEKEVETQYGMPSSRIIIGKIHGVDVCVIARHGRNHEIPPSQVNYKANIAALKMLGCTHIIATSAVGSLKEEIKPGDLVFPNQFIDFTKQRKSTFYDKIGEVVHLPLSDPFSEYLRKIMIETANELGYSNHQKATIAVIEGPRFSTRAESFMFRNFADIIGMTTVPEVVLAREAGIEYASVAMSTDYDCWKQDEEPVTFEIVQRRMKENADKVKELILKVIIKIKKQVESDDDRNYIKARIRTIPNWPKPGIMFRDITTLLKDAQGLQRVLRLFEERYKDKEIDLIAGIESRGFIVASALAYKLNKGVVLVRKPGKLPSETVKEEYDLEYGKDSVEIHKDAIEPGQRILMVDDLIATGGTFSAACKLVEKLGGSIVECACIVESPELKGREKLLKWPVFSLVDFEGE